MAHSNKEMASNVSYVTMIYSAFLRVFRKSIGLNLKNF